MCVRQRGIESDRPGPDLEGALHGPGRVGAEAKPRLDKMDRREKCRGPRVVGVGGEGLLEKVLSLGYRVLFVALKEAVSACRAAPRLEVPRSAVADPGLFPLVQGDL